MLFKEACWRMSKDARMALWMERLNNVDRAIERSNTGWQLELWNNVRRQLVRQLHLLSMDVREN
jgi:hypothetical protein